MIFALSDEFVNVANAKELQPSQMKAVEVNGEKVCLANVEGKYYAIGNVCTHLGGPLAEGKLEGYEVQCPWHGSRFDIRTGTVTKPPAARSEPTYEIKLENDNILVKNRAKSNQS
ncbi:MAG TPA: non-heme iron oxygenase ferredoxin subunit [Nitrososphaeraceae archaeon]|jgi:glycine betaine catabolism B|nr:non-heme iron oxygenase ferredoxin subunit [Nitrososphaeraceae archaeon]